MTQDILEDIIKDIDHSINMLKKRGFIHEDLIELYDALKIARKETIRTMVRVQPLHN